MGRSLFEDSKSNSVGVLCIFGSRTSVPISWMYKKQTSVSHSSTESEIISFDGGLRMDGLLALDSWECGDGSVTFIEQHRTTNLSSSRKLMINFRMWTTSPQTQILLKASLSCTSLKTMKQKRSSRAEVQR